MAPEPWLVAILSSAALWLIGSVVIGTIANHLPDAALQPVGSPPMGPGTGESKAFDPTCLGIRHWKRWIPDAGNALPGGMLKADLVRRDPAALQRLILETRRAAWVHGALWPCWIITALWLPPRGVLVNLIFATLFNLPCLLLQHSNRLRLQRTLGRLTGGGDRDRPGAHRRGAPPAGRCDAHRGT